MKSSIFWVITPCRALKNNRRYGGIINLHLQSRRISPVRNQREEGGKKYLFATCFMVVSSLAWIKLFNLFILKIVMKSLLSIISCNLAYIFIITISSYVNCETQSGRSVFFSILLPAVCKPLPRVCCVLLPYRCFSLICCEICFE
jgi:hypothetical protein